MIGPPMIGSASGTRLVTLGRPISIASGGFDSRTASGRRVHVASESRACQCQWGSLASAKPHRVTGRPVRSLLAVRVVPKDQPEPLSTGLGRPR